MTREEAIMILKYRRNIIGSIDVDWCANETEALDLALSALRPVSREQVEMVWRGEWTVDEFGHKCSKCGEYLPDGEDVRKPQFCPECGRAMTDEAVEMVMEKINNMEEMTNEH